MATSLSSLRSAIVDHQHFSFHANYPIALSVVHNRQPPLTNRCEQNFMFAVSKRQRPEWNKADPSLFSQTKSISARRNRTETSPFVSILQIVPFILALNFQQQRCGPRVALRIGNKRKRVDTERGATRLYLWNKVDGQFRRERAVLHFFFFFFSLFSDVQPGSRPVNKGSVEARI